MRSHITWQEILNAEIWTLHFSVFCIYFVNIIALVTLTRFICVYAIYTR